MVLSLVSCVQGVFMIGCKLRDFPCSIERCDCDVNSIVRMCVFDYESYWVY